MRGYVVECDAQKFPVQLYLLQDLPEDIQKKLGRIGSAARASASESTWYLRIPARRWYRLYKQLYGEPAVR